MKWLPLPAILCAVAAAVQAGEPRLPSTISIASPQEPGERLIISGTIYLPDGITPAKGAILALWHTDAKGYYAEEGGEAGEEHPRLHARLQTDADGKYEFRTIKPAPYPHRSVPAHIHGHISAPGFPEYAIVYYFEGDRFIKAEDRAKLNSYRGGTPSIIKLTRDGSGVWHGTRDIKLEHVPPDGQTMQLRW